MWSIFSRQVCILCHNIKASFFQTSLKKWINKKLTNTACSICINVKFVFVREVLSQFFSILSMRKQCKYAVILYPHLMGLQFVMELVLFHKVYMEVICVYSKEKP